MKWFHYPIIVVITIIVAFVFCRWTPRPEVAFTPDSQESGAGKGYHNWLYIDEIEGDLTLTDIDGNKMSRMIVTYKNDELIFVNRTKEPVNLSFVSDNIFGQEEKQFSIAPYKRVKRLVIGPPDEYSFTLEGGGGVVSPPKVKVGEEP